MGFFLCSKYAFTSLASDNFCNCSLGRVAPMLTSVFTAADRARRRRASPEDCNGNVILIGEDTALAMAVPVVSVPGLAFGNNRGLRRLACLVTKTINLTATGLSNIVEELDQVCSGVLLDCAAINYLLLKNHISCKSVPGGCCFNITNNVPYIVCH